MRKRLRFPETQIVPKRLSLYGLSIVDITIDNIVCIINHYFPARQLSENIRSLIDKIKTRKLTLNDVALLCNDYYKTCDVMDAFFNKQLTGDEIITILVELDEKLTSESDFNDEENELIKNINFRLLQSRYKKEEFDFSYLLVTTKTHWGSDDNFNDYYSFELIHDSDAALEYILGDRNSICFTDDSRFDIYKNTPSLIDIYKHKEQFSEEAYLYLQKVANGEYLKCFQIPRERHSEHYDGSPLWFLESLEWYCIDKDTYSIKKMRKDI